MLVLIIDLLHFAGGFGIPLHTFSCVGSPHTPISFTSKSDIGRVLAQLSILSMSFNSSAASGVPDSFRVGGTTKSYDDIKRVFEAEDESHDRFTEIKMTDLGIYRHEVKKVLGGALRRSFEASSVGSRFAFPPKRFPMSLKPLISYLCILYGECKFDFSQDNDNELANPGNGRRWKSMRGRLGKRLQFLKHLTSIKVNTYLIFASSTCDFTGHIQVNGSQRSLYVL